MNDTVFYVLGIALVVLALLASFLGLRFDKFPSSRLALVGGIAVFALLVLGTATFAWRNAVDEQSDREAELAEDVTANQESGNVGEAREEAGSVGGEVTTAATTTTSTTSGAADQAALDRGSQVFTSAGCSGCHTLAAAGSSGTTGPDLDGVLKGQSAEFIRTSIIDPNKVIAKGYPPDVMPQNFEQTLSSEDLDALVQYLVASTGGGAN